MPSIYAVRNLAGQWFRRKGFAGYGGTWVDDFARARIYTKIGGARGVITFFANAHPEYPAPDLVELVIGEMKVLDETTRVNKARDREEKRKAAQEVRRLEYQRQSAE